MQDWNALDLEWGYIGINWGTELVCRMGMHEGAGVGQECLMIH